MSPAEPSDKIAGVYTIELRSFADDRGYFFESFRRSWVPGAREMVQANVSFSYAGVIRGLHYHLKQADLWVVPAGRIQAALYDLRQSSPTRGAQQSLMLGKGYPIALYIPPGVAHGFNAMTDTTMTYLVDEFYDASDEHGVRWDDPALGITWWTPAPVLSDRDRTTPMLSEIPVGLLPP